MIEWAAAGSMLAAIARRRESIAAAAEEALKTWPKFRNIDYDLIPLPLVVSAERLEHHRRTVERYVDILERVIELYGREPDVRDYFGFSADEDALIRQDAGFRRNIRICRLDGYLAQRDGRLRILENNADCPAGILFTPRLNNLIDAVTAGALEDLPHRPEPMPLDRGDGALRQLLDSYREWGGEEAVPSLAILQVRGKSNVESMEMAAEFSAAGYPTVVADPREVSFTRGGAEIGGRPVHLVWNKINTVYWNQFLAESPGLLKVWMEAIGGRRICHVNPFSSRYIVESKRCLAFVQEPEYARHFSAEDLSFVEGLLPWARKLGRDREVEFEGERVGLMRLLEERQADFVLKEPYDIRGDGVTIGRSVDRSTWLRRLESGAENGHVAQAFIRPMQYPVMTLKDEAVTTMSFSLDSFVFGGGLKGLGSKASLEDKVNLFQGGRKLAVRVFAPGAAA